MLIECIVVSEAEDHTGVLEADSHMVEAEAEVVEMTEAEKMTVKATSSNHSIRNVSSVTKSIQLVIKRIVQHTGNSA